jgi:hypothetical protein
VYTANNKQHSVVKTIRLNKELNDFLDDEAKKSNITVSALASLIFTSYRDRYSFLDRLNPISMTPENLILFLENIDDDDLMKVAQIIASKVVLYKKHFHRTEKHGNALDWCIDELLPATHWFNCRNSKEGYMITHQMGGKWTVFLLSFLSSFVEADSGVKPSLTAKGDIIILGLPDSLVDKVSAKVHVT